MKSRAFIEMFQMLSVELTASEQMIYILIFGWGHLQPLAQAATCSHLSLKQVNFKHCFARGLLLRASGRQEKGTEQK